MYLDAPRWRKRLGLGIAFVVAATVLIVEAVLLAQAADTRRNGERVSGVVEAIEETKGIPVHARVALAMSGKAQIVSVPLAGVDDVPDVGDSMDVVYRPLGDGYRVVAADEDVGRRLPSDLVYVLFFVIAGTGVGLKAAGLRRGSVNTGTASLE